MQQGSDTAVIEAAHRSHNATLTDEQILGLEPMPSQGAVNGGASASLAQVLPPLSGGEPEDFFAANAAENPRVPSQEPRGEPELQSQRSDSSTAGPPKTAAADDPAWLKSLDAQPQGGAEAAAQARAWRAAATDVAALDAAYFSTKPSERAGLAQRLYDNDPAAFRAMLAESARMLSQRDPQGLAELARELGAPPNASSAPTLLNAASASPAQAVILSGAKDLTSLDSARGEILRRSADSAPQNDSTSAVAPGAVSAPTQFPAEAYRSFETATNDDVARRVHQAIDHTLGNTLPEGIAEGARRRIAEDIFQEVHASLAADRDLARRVGETLRDWRFDAAARQQVSSLLAGRARAVLPEVARRVVAEWTSSVLASDRAKTARIDAAASRRDITGGRLPEPVPASSLRPRDIDYRRLSDEQILEL